MLSHIDATSKAIGALSDERLGAVVDQVASREPLPAAGAAVAVTLSLAAALLEKAASAPRAGVPVDSAAQGRAGHLRHEALALADEDTAIYRRIVAAKGDDERVRSALSQFAEPPLAMAEIGLKLARLAERILADVPLSLQGDVRSAGHLACAAAKAATELVAIDVDSSRDERSVRATQIATEVAERARDLSSRALRR
jgi:formiminotetrahydrofolate cyclodeaminase